MNRKVLQNSVVVGNNSNNSGNTVNSHNNQYNISVSDEKPKILEWISPLTSRERHQAVRDARVDGVGEWLLRTESFSTWCTSEDGGAKPVLLCYGDPGVGKTYISSLVIDTLSGGAGAGHATVAYVYCDFTAQNVQSSKAVLASVLRQVVGALDQIPDEVQKAFVHAKAQVDGCGLRLKEILEMLTLSLSHSEKAYICVDALDEFATKHRAELWDCLRRVIRECPNSRLFLTGRPQIATEVEKYFPEHANMIIIEPDMDDLGKYIERRLEEDLDDNAMDKKLRADIFRIIPERISGIFLLVRINMDAILAGATIHQRSLALDRMTKGHGLQDAYTTTLDRIGQQGTIKGKLGMEALMWISHSKRALRSEELCYALGVELGAQDFNARNVPSIRTILACTLGLVTFDEKESTVRLLHHTLQEYLTGNPTLFVTPHSMIAEICLTYLNSRIVRALPLYLEPWRTPPFFEYATCYWGAHAAIEVTETIKQLALRHLDRYEYRESSIIFAQNNPYHYRLERVQPRGMSGLHCIAIFGIAEIASAMLKKKWWDINCQDSKGETPLNYALRWKNGRVVELFLQQEDIEPYNVGEKAEPALVLAIRFGRPSTRLLLERGYIGPNLVDIYGRIPLPLAAGYERESTVKLLLEHKNVDPNSADSSGQTPLIHAIVEDDEVVAKLLLEREDINSNLSCNNGITPLAYAVGCEHEALAKLLLARGDVDPNLVDKQGRTPLSTAIAEEVIHEANIVKLLLDREDLDPNSQDSSGRTALSFAAGRGNQASVELLLARGDVNPDLVDHKGLTPLLHAVVAWEREIHYDEWEWENDVVVKLLLERGDVDPNSEDSDGRTPLSLAAECGYKAIVKLLLERGDVNPNLVDKNGLTPLLHATSERGWENDGVVELLLERGDVDPNSQNSDGRTPLSLAAEYRHEVTVELLLKRDDINPDPVDEKGLTPLLYAVLERKWDEESVSEWEWENDVVKQLLERGDVNPNSQNSDGRTPLSLAAERGSEAVVKLLLEHDDVNPNSVDKNGLTPLLHATSEWGWENDGVVKLLLERGDVDPNSLDSDGRTPLSLAVERGNGAVVKLLLERGDVNPNSVDIKGLTPLLHVTSERGWENDGVVKLLLERGDVDPNSENSDGRTPLSFAAEYGYKATVELLLNRDDINPDPADEKGLTPLLYAVERVWEEGGESTWEGENDVVVKLLLERGDVNPNSENSDGRTPLSLAAERGNGAVVKLLLERSDVNPNSVDKNGLTPLLHASSGWGWESAGVVKLLLERGDIDPNSPDSDGRTPLSLAVERGNGTVVKLLLERGDINPDSVDKKGLTPLLYAVRKRKWEEYLET